jgi:four helix bundle protein
MAEGEGSGSDPESQHFLSYALRSSYEAMTALEITQRHLLFATAICLLNSEY